MFRSIWVAALIVAGSSACTTSDLGILSVHVTLGPVLVDLPEELAVLDAAAFGAGEGTIHTDVPTGTGSVEASELPELPDGFVYVPMLTFASHARAGLPETAGGDEGHSHGADGGGEEEDDHAEVAPDEGGGSVLVGPMEPVGHDGFIGLFSTADVGAHELGALRGGMVVIAAEDGSISDEIEVLPVLSGTVDFTGVGTVAGDPAEEEAGHAHGV